MDAKRKWYARYWITRTTTFTAVFAGDAYNAANSASLTLDAYARVTDWLTGAYKTSKNSDGVGLRRLPRHRHAHPVLDGGAEQARRVP